MERNTTAEPKALMETRLTHQTHRLMTALLAEAAPRPSVPLAALAQLRDFLVAAIRHHHETEDNLLWPRLAEAAPAAARALEELTDEHERLDTALDRLAAVAVDDEDARHALHEAAVAVRDSVLGHLEHEEPILLPALRDHMSPAAWDDFARQVIASTPPVALHLMIGFLDEAGTPEEVKLLLGGLPEPARPLVPAMRQQAHEELRVLRGSAA
ncbi:hemerythrin domain-containing protein [Streptomyces sp. FZ201]|uniref:hemerythrin domain-containing protein n=1 Tax=Streptomyces sp. FZ201 TaxID=3057122 RepID=UPI0021BF8515|nr:hemerythrin domain-containing protein [Streptomyces sp. FZ201]